VSTKEDIKIYTYKAHRAELLCKVANAKKFLNKTVCSTMQL